MRAGIWSSRGIERECREDVVYKVITALRVPDHSTIAEFRRRHERALGELFTEVLALCGEAGPAEVGVISIDGVKIRANASRGANRTYEKLVADILKEAEDTDRWEDGLFGPDRGDEVPEHLRSEDGRRTAFKAAKERLAKKAGRGEEPEATRIEPDPERFSSTRGWGRRTWHREAHKELLRRREQDAKPVARSRAERLLEALYRLEENQQVEIQASEAYERWQAERRAGGVPGQKLGMPPKPCTPPSGCRIADGASAGKGPPRRRCVGPDARARISRADESRNGSDTQTGPGIAGARGCSGDEVRG
jgi:hypothetical protein